MSYTELYEHIPWLTNTAEGLITLTHKDKVITTIKCEMILILSDDIQDLQMISSHRTCLLPLGLWCLTSQALNTFSQHGGDTSMREVRQAISNGNKTPSRHFGVGWVVVAHKILVSSP